MKLLKQLRFLVLGTGALAVAVFAGAGKPPTPPPPPTPEKIAFHNSDTRKGGLMTMNSDGTSVVRISTIAGSPDWSPDYDTGTPGYQGKIVARDASLGYTKHRLVLLNADGTGLEGITAPEFTIGYFRWSPDGRYIAFGTGSIAADCEGIWLWGPYGVEGVTPQLVQIFYDPVFYRCDWLTWTPDLDSVTAGYQGKLLFNSMDGQLNGDLMQMNFSYGTNGEDLVIGSPVPTGVGTSSSAALQIAQTPAGLRAAYRLWTNVGGVYGTQIVIADVSFPNEILTVTNPTVLVARTGYEMLWLRWSFDGTRLAYCDHQLQGSGYLPNTAEIYKVVVPNLLVAPLPTPVRLTNNKVADNWPVWSPPSF